MKNLFIIFLICSFGKIHAQENDGWKTFSDPMGDNFYAYVNAKGVAHKRLLYESTVNGCRFTFEPVKIYDFYGFDDKRTFEKITVKFKTNNGIVNLENYIKEKLPYYKNDNLVITNKYGYFLMGGYDSNYKYKAIGNNLHELIVDLFKKSSLVTIDYDGERFYYSTTGFSKAISICK